MPRSAVTPRLTLYGKAGCCLCDQAEAVIARVTDLPFTLEHVDINADPDLLARFGHVIPVLALDGEVVLVSKISEFWLRRILAGERNPRLSALPGPNQ